MLLARRAALQVLKQARYIVERFLAPFVGDGVAHAVISFPPIEKCLPVSRRYSHADEACCLVYVPLERIIRGYVVARVFGTLHALLHISDALGGLVELA